MSLQAGESHVVWLNRCLSCLFFTCRTSPTSWITLNSIQIYFRPMSMNTISHILASSSRISCCSSACALRADSVTSIMIAREPTVRVHKCACFKHWEQINVAELRCKERARVSLKQKTQPAWQRVWAKERKRACVCVCLSLWVDAGFELLVRSLTKPSESSPVDSLPSTLERSGTHARTKRNFPIYMTEKYISKTVQIKSVVSQELSECIQSETKTSFIYRYIYIYRRSSYIVIWKTATQTWIRQISG